MQQYSSIITIYDIARDIREVETTYGRIYTILTCANLQLVLLPIDNTGSDLLVEEDQNGGKQRGNYA